MKYPFQIKAEKLVENYFSTLSLYHKVYDIGGLSEEEYKKSSRNLRFEVIQKLIDLGYDNEEAVAFTQVESKEEII